MTDQWMTGDEQKKMKLAFVLAEDNPGDVFLIRRALDSQSLSYDLVVARDGAEAIRYVDEAADGNRRIDLLLLDLNLPKRDGSEVLSELRTHTNLAKVPAIVLTSSSSPQDRERCLRLGANRFFQKPSDLVHFMEIGKLIKDLLAAEGVAAS
jgi:CheY-like chemotaxis protein